MKTEKDEKDNPVSSTVDEIDQAQSASQSPDTTTTLGADKEATNTTSSEAKSDSSKKLEVEGSEPMDVDNDDSSKVSEVESLDKKKNKSTTERPLVRTTARKSTAGKSKFPLKEDHSPSDNQESSDNAAKSSENVSDTREKMPKPCKKYIYKLKAKSGKVLKYTSMVPIVLKKPVIRLDKMADTDDKNSIVDQSDEVDSDNSSKENHGKSNDTTLTTKRRGRPPLSQKKASIATQEDAKPNAEDLKSSPYSMQTRKRQLKFMPDGRLVSPGEKKSKLASSDDDASGGKMEEDKSDLSYNESDAADESDSSMDRRSKKSMTVPSKKFSSLEKKIMERNKPKKEFDFENYIREKTSQTVKKSPEKVNSTVSTSTTKKPPTTTNGTSKSTTESVKKSAVDPAQLLSSLIGTTILPSQLNVVKFVPKVIHERKNIATTSSTLKKITLDKLTPKGSLVTTQKAPFRFVSKTTSLTTTTTTSPSSSSASLPKILPKPTSTVTSTVTTPVRKPIERQLFTPASSFRQFSSIAPKPTVNATSTPLQTIKSNAIVQMNDSSGSKENNLPKFDHYTDTRRVYTKNGPKRPSQIQNSGDSCKTIYDLMVKVFDQMPSWNLHVVPDTNTFCIAQVARGRMGLPALVKSIEMTESFHAKVYVHQLHCKRFDGVYDSESKILSLIREIDALAA